MSIEETKQLLRTHRITPNKLMGQNFMVELSLYPKMCTYVALSAWDVVLDAGAGFGWLTRFLAGKCKKVIAVAVSRLGGYILFPDGTSQKKK